MKKVILESPFAGNTKRNIKYARRAMRDSLLRDESPFASHLLYTQPGILNDNIKEERKLGIDAGLLWGIVAEKTVVYQDYGLSDGMVYGIENAKKSNRPIEYRTIGKNSEGIMEKFLKIALKILTAATAVAFVVLGCAIFAIVEDNGQATFAMIMSFVMAAICGAMTALDIRALLHKKE